MRGYSLHKIQFQSLLARFELEDEGGALSNGDDGNDGLDDEDDGLDDEGDELDQDLEILNNELNGLDDEDDALYS
jgi:hypothetical protein